MTVKWSGKWHPLAERFPMLDEDEVREMAASIAAHGQFVPCQMDANGLGLDGRNRSAACALASVEPRWEVYEGDPVAFIVQVNADRRHLSTGQRAMAVAIGLVDVGARSNGRFKRGSVPDNPSSRDKTWAEAVRRAGLVLDYAPELADQVLMGGLALDAAHKQADDVRRRKERLAALDTERAGLVESGVVTLAEAEHQIADEARVTKLSEDLAKRVRDGALSLDEAELIAGQHRERLLIWAQQVRDSLGVLARMAGYPVPVDLAALLDPAEVAALDTALDALNRKDDDA